MFKVEQTGSATDQAWGVRERVLSSVTLGFDLHNWKDREVILLMGYGQELTAALGAQEPETEEAAGAGGSSWGLAAAGCLAAPCSWLSRSSHMPHGSASSLHVV